MGAVGKGKRGEILYHTECGKKIMTPAKKPVTPSTRVEPSAASLPSVLSEGTSRPIFTRAHRESTDPLRLTRWTGIGKHTYQGMALPHRLSLRVALLHLHDD